MSAYTARQGTRPKPLQGENPNPFAMEIKLALDILPQPDDVTCGPTCLHAVCCYYGDARPLGQVITATASLPTGGTSGVLLACHALRHGHNTTIYTSNLPVFDSTWFPPKAKHLSQRRQAQMAHKHDTKLPLASAAYIEFLSQGGPRRFVDLTATLIRRYLRRAMPILTGLSATYLYHEAREIGPHNTPDDLHGVPIGHFVVLCGYDCHSRQVLIADPLQSNPVSATRQYIISIDRVIGAILLGVLTCDANLVIIEPR